MRVFARILLPHGDGLGVGCLALLGELASPKAYMDKYRQLAGRFIDNFRKFAGEAPAEVAKAGPKV